MENETDKNTEHDVEIRVRLGGLLGKRRILVTAIYKK